MFDQLFLKHLLSSRNHVAVHLLLESMIRSVSDRTSRIALFKSEEGFTADEFFLILQTKSFSLASLRLFVLAGLPIDSRFFLFFLRQVVSSLSNSHVDDFHILDTLLQDGVHIDNTLRQVVANSEFDFRDFAPYIGWILERGGPLVLSVPIPGADLKEWRASLTTGTTCFVMFNGGSFFWSHRTAVVCRKMQNSCSLTFCFPTKYDLREGSGAIDLSLINIFPQPTNLLSMEHSFVTKALRIWTERKRRWFQLVETVSGLFPPLIEIVFFYHSPTILGNSLDH